LFDRLTERQWIGWQLYAKHFSTPLTRADINAALIQRATLAGPQKKLPTVTELMPRYGNGKRKKTPAEVFKLAEIAATQAAADSKAKPPTNRKSKGK
jgi:hypothetical protein